MRKNSILDFWNRQAALSEKTGTSDLIAKELEMAALARHIQDGMRVCEFGCGKGVTAIDLACRFDIRIDHFWPIVACHLADFGGD